MFRLFPLISPPKHQPVSLDDISERCKKIKCKLSVDENPCTAINSTHLVLDSDISIVSLVLFIDAKCCIALVFALQFYIANCVIVVGSKIINHRS